MLAEVILIITILLFIIFAILVTKVPTSQNLLNKAHVRNMGLKLTVLS